MPQIHSRLTIDGEKKVQWIADDDLRDVTLWPATILAKKSLTRISPLSFQQLLSWISPKARSRLDWHWNNFQFWKQLLKIDSKKSYCANKFKKIR